MLRWSWACKQTVKIDSTVGEGVTKAESVLLELGFKFLCEAPVGLECGILGVFGQSWVPIVELIEAVAEANALRHSQVAQVLPGIALCEALLVQVRQKSIVLLHLAMEVIFSTQS